MVINQDEEYRKVANNRQRMFINFVRLRSDNWLRRAEEAETIGFTERIADEIHNVEAQRGSRIGSPLPKTEIKVQLKTRKLAKIPYGLLTDPKFPF